MRIKQPDILPYAKGVYILDEDYSYTWLRRGTAGWSTIIVKKGFKYDGASTPRFTWTIAGILPDGLLRAASLIHDGLYRYCGEFPPDGHKWVKVLEDATRGAYIKFSRKECDQLFFQIMQESGVEKLHRHWAYQVVRLFGWWAWMKNKKKQRKDM